MSRLSFNRCEVWGHNATTLVRLSIVNWTCVLWHNRAINHLCDDHLSAESREAWCHRSSSSNTPYSLCACFYVSLFALSQFTRAVSLTSLGALAFTTISFTCTNSKPPAANREKRNIVAVSNWIPNKVRSNFGTDLHSVGPVTSLDNSPSRLSRHLRLLYIIVRERGEVTY